MGQKLVYYFFDSIEKKIRQIKFVSLCVNNRGYIRNYPVVRFTGESKAVDYSCHNIYNMNLYLTADDCINKKNEFMLLEKCGIGSYKINNSIFGSNSLDEFDLPFAEIHNNTVLAWYWDGLKATQIEYVDVKYDVVADKLFDLKMDKNLQTYKTKEECERNNCIIIEKFPDED